MAIKLNLTNIEVNSYEALPAGMYVVTVTGGEMRETKGGENSKLPSGTPMINWEFTVVDGVEGEKYKGRKIWTNTIIHEKTLWNLKSLLLATGKFDDEDLADLDFEIEDIIGETVQVKVARREYNGNETNEIKLFKSVGSSESSGSLLP